MPLTEDVYYQASEEEGSNSQRFFTRKVGLGGACLAFVSLVGLFCLNSTSVGTSTDLIGMPTSLRAGAQMFTPAARPTVPGAPSPWKDLALAAIKDHQSCDRAHRDVSANAFPNMRAALAKMPKEDLRVLGGLTKRVQARAQQLVANAQVDTYAGMVGPVEGLWDPFGFAGRATEGELAFYREAELKHGRVCMLASLGFWTQENFHPLFGGDLDGPAIQAAVEPILLPFWAAIFLVIGVPEVASLSRIDYAAEGDGFALSLQPDVEPGDFGFDPLGLKPDEPEELLKRQNQEILHGRLGMIAAAGMIAQEVLTQSRLDEGGIYTYG